MDLIVIEEIDKSDDEKQVIGVASTVEYAEIMIQRFYGGVNKFVINSKKQIQESGLEYSMEITVLEEENFEEFDAIIVLRKFKLNE